MSSDVRKQDLMMCFDLMNNKLSLLPRYRENSHKKKDELPINGPLSKSLRLNILIISPTRKPSTPPELKLVTYKIGSIITLSYYL